MVSSDQKVAIVTGSSRGIGLEIALTLARNKFLTYATMRNISKSNGIKSEAEKENLPIRILQLDVTDKESISNAIRQIESEAGRIDTLVNNAGYALSGAFEDLSMDEIKDQYETNVFGVVRTSQAVLPTMRRQRSGRIINISSGLGMVGLPGLSAYSSTKFAIEGWSESMAYELDPFGIKVVLIEPGVVKTEFGKAGEIAKKSQHPSSPYYQMMEKMAGSFQYLLENASSVNQVAKIVLEAATTEKPNLRYLAGKDIETWIKSKRNMTDDEFYSMMKQNL
jgi:NAD(P)-dependent dehydrogenase (short-subunit alcohol dehydrogenase family)